MESLMKKIMMIMMNIRGIYPPYLLEKKGSGEAAALTLALQAHWLRVATGMQTFLFLLLLCRGLRPRFGFAKPSRIISNLNKKYCLKDFIRTVNVLLQNNILKMLF